MILYAIRHGQTEYNISGLLNGQLEDALTDEGIIQARNAGKLIAKSVKRIYASSLGRAKRTAELLNADLGLPITLHDELKEVNFGEKQGGPYLDEYKEKHYSMNYDWRPTGESMDDVKKRVLNILGVIASENGDGEALIVTHGGIIRMLCYLESGDILDDVGNTSLHTFDLDKILSRS